MTEEKKQTLKQFLIALAETRPELRKKGGAKIMYDEAIAAGYNCSMSSIHTIRYMEALTEGYDTPRKRSRARNRAHEIARLKKAEWMAKKRLQKKAAERALERAKVVEKVYKPKKGVTTHPGESSEPASYSEHDRAFLSALRRIGAQRGRELIELAVFLEAVS